MTTGSADPAAPLVVLLLGRDADESSILALATHLPTGPTHAALRAPIREGGGYAWFANRGIGRPVAESLADTMAWFSAWLDGVARQGPPVVLIGFSGGAAFAGGLVLSDPQRYAGTAILLGALPFEAGVAVESERLHGIPSSWPGASAMSSSRASSSTGHGATSTTSQALRSPRGATRAAMA